MHPLEFARLSAMHHERERAHMSRSKLSVTAQSSLSGLPQCAGDFVRRIEAVEKVLIICPVGKKYEILDEMQRDGWRLIHGGPYFYGENPPKMDAHRWCAMFERSKAIYQKGA